MQRFRERRGAFDTLCFVFGPSATMGDAVKRSYLFGLDMVYRLHLGMEVFGACDDITKHNDTNGRDGTVRSAELPSRILGLGFER